MKNFRIVVVSTKLLDEDFQLHLLQQSTLETTKVCQFQNPTWNVSRRIRIRFDSIRFHLDRFEMTRFLIYFKGIHRRIILKSLLCVKILTSTIRKDLRQLNQSPRAVFKTSSQSHRNPF
eukprot:TRINITY_DN886_c0_g3_i1.p10 TRINITY_DN886_c0_g3~~TRINITY_DN886_c0_g3_i1.p10  ORF type:complete len:119 (+),score=2.75 TRINITY_DN886_c0_g3_i1:1767-2123(+)